MGGKAMKREHDIRAYKQKPEKNAYGVKRKTEHFPHKFVFLYILEAINAFCVQKLRLCLY